VKKRMTRLVAGGRAGSPSLFNVLVLEARGRLDHWDAIQGALALRVAHHLLLERHLAGRERRARATGAREAEVVRSLVWLSTTYKNMTTA
jgi:hypothetical protein